MWSVWSGRLLRVTGRNFHQRSIVSGLHSMAEGTNNGGNGSRDKSSPDEAALSARLGSLDHRLSEIRDSRKTRTDQPGSGSGDGSAKASAMARGFRLSPDLLPGVSARALLAWAFYR